MAVKKGLFEVSGSLSRAQLPQEAQDTQVESVLNDKCKNETKKI